MSYVFERALRGFGSTGWTGSIDPDTISPTDRPALCGGAKTTQAALKDLGYYTGAIDGIFGSGSIRAMALFNQANGLPAVSWPTPAWCAQLAKVYHARFDAPPPVLDQPVDPGQPQPIPGGSAVPVPIPPQPQPVDQGQPADPNAPVTPAEDPDTIWGLPKMVVYVGGALLVVGGIAAVVMMGGHEAAPALKPNRHRRYHRNGPQVPTLEFC